MNKDPHFSQLPAIDTQEKLEERCRYWQQVLRLKDWTIRIRFTSVGEINSQGQVDMVAKSASARIIICPYEYTPDGLMRDPIEKTIIHELLHLHFDWIRTDLNREDILEEQTIDKLAWALLEQHYGGIPQNIDDYQNFTAISNPPWGQ